ncbi:DUF3299 domain-containing protein [Botrimarina sp.]|uniref:DUF3299 domain-containing protein n=1 Tax=Botrimarina sp. TaxID=2795802 RepID=UPI0032ED4A48
MNGGARYCRPLLAGFAAALVAALGCDDRPSPPVASVEPGAGGRVKTSADAEPAPAKPPASEPRDAAELLDKNFDDIKFEMELGAPFDRSLLTDAVRDLDGRRIRIRGYILPTATKSGIKQFVLVRDNQECCFGPGAALFDCILVTMAPGETARFSVRPVAVEGRFTIDEFLGPGGYPLAIYRMDGERVDY